MISMTGYAYREKANQDFSAAVEVKGYNSRFLEISINLPPGLSLLETKIREQFSAAFGRGKIEIFIRVREHNAPVNIKINTKAAKAYYDAANTLAAELGIEAKLDLKSLLQMEGILETEKNRADERCWNEIESLLKEALLAFSAEREREGSHTEENIFSNLKIISVSVEKISAFVPVIENNLKNNIKSRFAELLGNQVDENRVLAETAALLLKYTISEELSRLSSHLAEFKAEAERNKRPGKKLDFLCQEINREINTIGSKSVIIEVSSEVVKMKEALENIREQLRNIE